MYISSILTNKKGRCTHEYITSTCRKYQHPNAGSIWDNLQKKNLRKIIAFISLAGVFLFATTTILLKIHTLGHNMVKRKHSAFVISCITAQVCCVRRLTKP